MFDLIGYPCQDIKSEEFLSIDLGCMSEFFSGIHIYKRTYDCRCTDIYSYSIQSCRSISGFKSNDPVSVDYSSVISRHHGVLAQSFVFETLAACLCKHLIFERRLVLKRRLVDRNSPFNDILIKIKIRHISGSKDIVLFFLLEKLYFNI